MRKHLIINKKIYSIFMLLILSLILFLCGKYILGFSDLYHKYIYFFLVNTVSRAFSKIPFSVYEIILYCFALFIVYRIIRYIVLLVKKKVTFKNVLISSICNILLYVSIFIFLNVVSQGVNCFKSDFITLSGLQMKDVNQEDLVEICTYYKDKLNELDSKISRDENGLIILDKDVKKQGVNIMNEMGSKYECLEGFYPNPKAYIYSNLMSYQFLQGETTFTIEANYNKNMPSFDVPSTICHELSHIRGFNNEYEANYISFLACTSSEIYEYQYSGYMMAYSYAMNDLYHFNEEAFSKISSDLSQNVKNEIKQDVLYWNQFRGTISNLYNDIYDILLKIGGQEEGMASYSSVVKLLIGGYKVQYNT